MNKKKERYWCVKGQGRGVLVSLVSNVGEDDAIKKARAYFQESWEWLTNSGYSCFELNEVGNHPDTIRATELQTQLDAWQRVFGTSQLTHAQARLEAAEKHGKNFNSIKRERIAKAMELALLELQL